MKGGKRVQPVRPNRINREIRAAEVRLTGIDGEQIGIVSLNEALEKAEEAGVGSKDQRHQQQPEQAHPAPV